MNAFREHHQHSIRFHYRCFDRILLNGIIQPFQQEGRVVGFFNTYRQVYPVSRDVLRDIATQFHNWVKNRSQRWDVPILDAPVGRRDEFVDPYFKRAKTDAVVCIVKCREPARILTAHRQEAGEPLASGVETALGRPVQLLPQRQRLGPHVRAAMPVLSLLRAAVFEPASLDRPPPVPAGNPVPAMQQCLYPLRQHHGVAGHRRFAHRARPYALRAEVAHKAHALLHRTRTAGGRGPAPPVLCLGRVLRQPDLLAPCGARCPGRPATRRQPHHRPAQQAHRYLRPPDHRTVQRQAADGDRGHEPAQSGHP